MIVISKEADSYRWFGVTTNNYQDRDGDIISLAVHQKDVARMQESGFYGTANWWHVYYKETPDGAEFIKLSDMTIDEILDSIGEKQQFRAVDLATCDYSEMLGGFRVESGVFFDSAVGEAFEEHAGDLEFSIEFLFAGNKELASELDEIFTFRRSFLPKGKASNQFTASIKEVSDMSTFLEKLQGLVNVAGEEKAEQLLNGAIVANDTAQDAGVDSKEANTTIQSSESESVFTEAQQTAIDKIAAQVSAEIDGILEDIYGISAKEEERPSLNDTLIALAKSFSDEAKSIKSENIALKDTLNGVVKTVGELETQLKELGAGQPSGLSALFGAIKQQDTDTGTVVDAGKNVQAAKKSLENGTFDAALSFLSD